MNWIQYEKDPVNGCFYKVQEKPLFINEIKPRKKEWNFALCTFIIFVFIAVELIILGSL